MAKKALKLLDLSMATQSEEQKAFEFMSQFKMGVFFWSSRLGWKLSFVSGSPLTRPEQDMLVQLTTLNKYDGPLKTIQAGIKALEEYQEGK